jgi:hypothetical protein
MKTCDKCGTTLDNIGKCTNINCQPGLSNKKGFLSKNSCKSCLFFDNADYTEDDNEIGKCRRFPPVAHPDIKKDHFPVVSTKDWCGEHRVIQVHKEERPVPSLSYSL